MKKILIYGGSSLISVELIRLLYNQIDKFVIFCRNKNKFIEEMSDLNFEISKFDIKEVDLENLKQNIEITESINTLHGIYWISGFNGDVDSEIKDPEDCKKNIKINFLHPTIIINNLIPKLKGNKNLPYIVAVTSVAGLRGRAKNIFYGSAKSALIAYLSGLRQKYNDRIDVITVIPGYISTRDFKINAPSFLISTPTELAKKIVNSVTKRREIVYSSFFWRVIMLFIRLIPEKIFKKLNF